jgi:hypothetical protein
MVHGQAGIQQNDATQSVTQSELPPSAKGVSCDRAELLKTLQVLIGQGQVVEIRALEVTNDRGYSRTFSGYFDNAETAADCILDLENLCSSYKGIYFTLNPVNPDLLARRCNRLDIAGKGDASTSDRDIAARRWLLVDIDPVRPSGISSTDTEHDYALKLAARIAEECAQQGWPRPLLADSGNGAHLLYRIALPRDDMGMVEKCLVALHQRYGDEKAHIDQSVHNPARICRCYGTGAHKGDSTATRPHRMSRILDMPVSLEVVPTALLEALAASVSPSAGSATPTATPMIRPSATSRRIDVPAFLEKHGLKAIGPEPYEGGQKWVFVVCPWNADHTNGSAFLIQFPSGAMSAGCHHDGCKSQNWHTLRELVGDRASPAGTDGAPGNLPEVLLPGGTVSISSASAEFGKLFAATGKYYNWGNAYAAVKYSEDGNPSLEPLKPAALASRLESVARLRTHKVSQKEGVTVVPAICSEQTAKVIAACEAFLDALPPIKLLSPCPVLVEQDGKLIQVSGYDRASGILAGGEAAPEIPLDQAKTMLRGLLEDFTFATEADRSRALAAMITPALVFGGLLGGRAPLDLGEANESQSGKGYRNKITSALYNQGFKAVTQKSNGVGSLEESFNECLVRGSNFICLDNIRGKINCPALESFLTEDNYSARVPHQNSVEIDPRRVIVGMTSNAADITTDLANRCSCVRILKRDATLPFKVYAEGDVLDHVRARQPEYLGAVFAVIKAWHAAGKPRTDERRHDFRPWAGTLDWIVQRLLGAVPLLDGHQATQARMTNPSLTWLRGVAIAVKQAGKLGVTMRTNELRTLLETDGSVELPVGTGVGILADGSVLQALGRKLASCFRGVNSVDLDAIRVVRGVERDTLMCKEVKSYTFTDIPQ